MTVCQLPAVQGHQLCPEHTEAPSLEILQDFAVLSLVCPIFVLVKAPLWG